MSQYRFRICLLLCRETVTAATVLTNAVILLPLEGMLMSYVSKDWGKSSAPSFLSLDWDHHVPKLGRVQASGTTRLPTCSHRLPAANGLHSRSIISFCVSEIVPKTKLS